MNFEMRGGGVVGVQGLSWFSGLIYTIGSMFGTSVIMTIIMAIIMIKHQGCSYNCVSRRMNKTTGTLPFKEHKIGWTKSNSNISFCYRGQFLVQHDTFYIDSLIWTTWCLCLIINKFICFTCHMFPNTILN